MLDWHDLNHIGSHGRWTGMAKSKPVLRNYHRYDVVHITGNLDARSLMKEAPNPFTGFTKK